MPLREVDPFHSEDSKEQERCDKINEGTIACAQSGCNSTSLERFQFKYLHIQTR